MPPPPPTPTPTPTQKRRLVEFLSRGLCSQSQQYRDDKLTLCVGCLAEANSILQALPTLDASGDTAFWEVDIRTRGRVFWNQAMAFIAQLGEPMYMLTLQRNLEAIRKHCPRSVRALHDAHHGQRSGLFTAILEVSNTLHKMLTTCLKSVPRLVELPVESGNLREGSSGAWPATLRDLFPDPSGAGKHLHAVVLQLDVLQDASHTRGLQDETTIFALLTQLVSIAGPQVIAAASSRIARGFPKAVCTRLKINSEKLLDNIVPGAPLADPLKEVVRFLDALNCLGPEAAESVFRPNKDSAQDDDSSFSSNVFDSGYINSSDTDSHDAVLKEAVDAAIVAASRAVGFGSITLHNTVKTLYFNVTHVELKSRLDHELISLIAQSWLQETRQRDLQCDSPDCKSTASARTTPMQCSGCKMFVYCSTACQRAHWSWKGPISGGVRAHKNVCKIFQDVGNSIPFSLSPQEFGGEVRKHGVAIGQLIVLEYYLSCSRDRLPDHSAEEMQVSLDKIFDRMVDLKRWYIIEPDSGN